MEVKMREEHCEEAILQDTAYCVDGFETIDIVKDDESVTFRTNVKCKEDFESWKNLFFWKNKVCFNSYKMFSVTGKKIVFRQQLMCHHGQETHKGVKKTYTGCKVFMDATIRVVRATSSEDIRNFPCFMKIKGIHNHPLDSAEALNQLRVSPCTREMYESYFRQGMTAGQAYRHHLLKMELSDDIYNQVNNSMNPSPKSVEYMWDVWRKREHGKFNTPSMFDSIRSYAAKNPDLIISISNEGDQFAVVLVTPFMMRAHRHLQEAGEVVFVDAASCVHHVNTAVIPLLCAGPAGAVPLAVLFTSSQDEATLTKGFGMVKEAIGDCGFYGQGGPQCFMTDNCTAKRNALAAAWPNSNQYLCIFHILQQSWWWLLDSKHGIKKDDRQELIAAVKMLVHADSVEAFDSQLEKIQHSPLLEKYSNFKSYLINLVRRKEECSVAFRAGAMLRGHHTNNYCESTMYIIKDNVLNRCKAYNTAQLVMFMAEIFDSYMKQRIVDLALNRRHSKRVMTNKLPLESMQSLGGGMYKVQSESNPTVLYEVDLNIGLCTCTKGNTGAICKHQVACADHGSQAVPQMLVLTSFARHQLAVLALGMEKAPKEIFLKSLKEPKVEDPCEAGVRENSCNFNVESESTKSSSTSEN